MTVARLRQALSWRKSSDASQVVLHVGTHKTATTSVQVMLAQNARLLEKNGVLYPNAGRLATLSSGEMDGHHNIAWELAGDSRFDAARGTFAQALDEIRRRRPLTAILSSEDFEYLYRSPGSLAAIAEGIRSINGSPRIVLYLRSQEDYAPSLYATLALKAHGLACSLASFLSEIHSQGSFSFRGWSFCFDYEVLTRAFKDAFGPESMVVRSFDPSNGGDAVLRDFLFACAPSIDFERVKRPGRLNEANNFVGVLDSLHATLTSKGARIPDVHSIAKELLSADNLTFLAGPFDPLTDEERARLMDRFAESNARVAQEFGIRLVSAPVPALRSTDEQKVKRLAVYRAAMQQWGLQA